MSCEMKQRVFAVIQPDRGESVLSKTFDVFITALILGSVASVFAATFDLPKRACDALSGFDAAVSVIFTVEYALRLWTADRLYPEISPRLARCRYAVSAMAVVDLLAILPFWLPMILPGTMLGLRALRLVRLLRILKLNRYFDALRSIWEVLVDKKRELFGSVFFIVLLMTISSLLMYSAEHDAQPDVFRNAFSGLWWAVATLTTVGYGDIYPVTVLGRIFGALIAFSGIAAVAIPTGIFSSGLSERMQRGKSTAEEPIRAGEMNEECRRLIRELVKVWRSEEDLRGSGRRNENVADGGGGLPDGRNGVRGAVRGDGQERGAGQAAGSAGQRVLLQGGARRNAAAWTWRDSRRGGRK